MDEEHKKLEKVAALALDIRLRADCINVVTTASDVMDTLDFISYTASCIIELTNKE